MMEAERQNLEGVEQIRALVGKDEENFSWKIDLANALIARAEFLKEKKQIPKRMQALNEAVLIFSRSIRDVNDADTNSYLASAYRERAAAWQDQGDVEKALEDLQQARVIYEGLVNAHPDHPMYRYELINDLSEEIKLRGKSGDQSVVAILEKEKAEQERANDRIRNARDSGDDYQNPQWDQEMEVANQAKEQNKPETAIAAYQSGIKALLKDAEADPKRAAIWNMLAQAQQGLAKTLGEFKRLTESIETYRQALLSAKKAAEISPKKAQYQNNLSVAHIDLGDALQASVELEAARDQFRDSLAPLRAAMRLDPTEPVYLGTERDVFRRIFIVDEALLKRNPESQNHFFEEREWVLRQGLYAAWNAWAFSSDQKRNEQNKELLMAKRNLAKFLTFQKQNVQKQNVEQAMSLMEQALIDAEKTVGADPTNPEYHCRLGEADFAIGLLRREQSLPGWEESIRKGLLAIDWGISIAVPEEPLCFMYSGSYRKKLGEYLLQDGRREEGKSELEMALSASQRALKLCPDNEQVKRDIEEEREILKQDQ